MDKILLLAQLIKNGELGNSSSSTENTVVLDYDFHKIFFGWSEPDTNHPEYYILEPVLGDESTDILYTELVKILNKWDTVSNVELATNKIICCGNQNCANVILDNFRVRNGSGSAAVSCTIHYYSGGYWLGKLEGTLTVKFDSDSSSTPTPLDLYLDTEYGINTLYYRRDM